MGKVLHFQDPSYVQVFPEQHFPLVLNYLLLSINMGYALLQ